MVNAQTIKDIRDLYNDTYVSISPLLRKALLEIIRSASGAGAYQFKYSQALSKLDRDRLESLGFKVNFDQDNLLYIISIL